MRRSSHSKSRPAKPQTRPMRDAMLRPAMRGRYRGKPHPPRRYTACACFPSGLALDRDGTPLLCSFFSAQPPSSDASACVEIRMPAAQRPCEIRKTSACLMPRDLREDRPGQGIGGSRQNLHDDRQRRRKLRRSERGQGRDEAAGPCSAAQAAVRAPHPRLRTKSARARSGSRRAYRGSRPRPARRSRKPCR